MAATQVPINHTHSTPIRYNITTDTIHTLSQPTPPISQHTPGPPEPPEMEPEDNDQQGRRQQTQEQHGEPTQHTQDDLEEMEVLFLGNTDWLNASYRPSNNLAGPSGTGPSYAAATSSRLSATKEKLLEELHTIRVSFHNSAKAQHHKLFAQQCLAEGTTPQWLKLQIDPNFAGDNGETRSSHSKRIYHQKPRTVGKPLPHSMPA